MSFLSDDDYEDISDASSLSESMLSNNDQDWDCDTTENNEELQNDDLFTDITGIVDHNSRIEYTCLVPTNLNSVLETSSTDVSAVLGIDADHANVLLRLWKWDVDKLVEDYLEDPDKVVGKAGWELVDVDRCGKSSWQRTRRYTCPLCCDEGDLLTLTVPGCPSSHSFCQECWTTWITQEITSGKQTITCAGCKHIITDNQLSTIASNDLLTHHLNLRSQSYIALHPTQFRHCPAPNCLTLFQVPLPPTAPFTLRCPCTSTICFHCGLPTDHRPTLCTHHTKWLTKNAAESENSKWISSNTKDCIKCSTPIEKNGGCSHMACAKCQTHFCWACMKPWHGYNSTCNRFDLDAEGVNDRDRNRTARMLKRYLHYFTRYDLNDKAGKMTERMAKKAEEAMGALVNEGYMGMMQTRFLAQAVDVLKDARIALKYSYITAYYLSPHSNHTTIFEQNQQDLESVTERLSNLVEMDAGVYRHLSPEQLSEQRLMVLDLTAYVRKRRLVLLNDFAEGVECGRWVFDEEGC